jgi:hypothetical protein
VVDIPDKRQVPRMFTCYTVVSGQDYPVSSLLTTDRMSLDDLSECPGFCVEIDGRVHLVRGEGHCVDGAVRFYEKCDEGHGKDVRVWTLRQRGGRLIATP